MPRAARRVQGVAGLAQGLAGRAQFGLNRCATGFGLLGGVQQALQFAAGIRQLLLGVFAAGFQFADFAARGRQALLGLVVFDLCALPRRQGLPGLA